MDNKYDLTFRQIVLLKLLQASTETFQKRTFVPKLLNAKEWKYCNSLVDGNCLWFGGQTTRKETTKRAVVHHSELGFENKLKLITHADASHRTYKMDKDNIKRYLLATLSKKYNFGVLPKILDGIEEEYQINLRNIIVEAK
ncbi:hypothetical protein KY326_04040 [Candidatus Woesearchaeota archaeon]|nr:hypothetical protein [Candidatus Woesearchaeota archaeon]